MYKSIFKTDNGYKGYINLDSGNRKYFSAKTKKSVNDKINSYILDSNTEKDIVITLSDYIRDYLYNYKLGHIKDTTFDRYESAFNNHIKNSQISNLLINNINPNDIQCFINTFPQKYSYSTSKKLYEILTMTFRFAYNSQDIKLDINSIINLPPKSKFKDIKIVLPYTKYELDIMNVAFVDKYVENPRLYRYAPVYTFISITGLRLGELLALRWSDINMIDRIIDINKTVSVVKDRKRGKGVLYIITKPKTQKSIRSIYLSDKAIELLNIIYKRNEELNYSNDYIVSGKNDGFIQPSSFQKTFRNICKDCNIEHRGIHALRHTFASNLIEKGVDVKVVSELLGHTSIQFTYDRYVHSSNDSKKNALKML